MFDLKLSVVSNEEFLYYDVLGVILCVIGVWFKLYCLNVVWLIMIDVDKI